MNYFKIIWYEKRDLVIINKFIFFVFGKKVLFVIIFKYDIFSNKDIFLFVEKV